MKRRLRYGLGITAILGALAYLIGSALSSATVYYFTVDELLARGVYIYGKPTRVSGLVDGTSIAYDPERLTLSFAIEENGHRLPALYHGARPDNFTEGAKVILEGRLDESGVMQARQLLMTCPSRYEAAAAPKAPAGPPPATGSIAS